MAHGHDVTVFNRGRTGPTVAGCTQLTGDRRSGDLSELARGRWDAVVDVCGYTVADVERVASALGSRVGHYCFISTGAVYADLARPITEDTRLVAPFASVPTEQDLISHYAELKVACELALRDLLGERLSIARPGVVVAPGDYTDRLTYWVRRLADGGDVLGPPRAEQPLQLLHARDLAETVLGLVSDRASACMNVAGPEITFADLVAAGTTAAGNTARMVWGGPDDLPLAAPADGSHDGAYRLRSRSGEVGAGHQPLVRTCRQILDWDIARGRPALRVGVGGPDAERALIAEVQRLSAGVGRG